MSERATTIGKSSSLVPRTIVQGTDGKYTFTARAGDPSVGNHVHIELQNPANADAIYTVPSGKTFNGSILIQQATAGASLGVSAATGGQQAKVTGAGTTVADVSIAGGSGNALTATVSGGALGVVVLDGYVK